MEILIKGSQLLLSLSILVVLHEFGHFLPAKLFKTKVEKFYLFFDPWFSLFKYKKGDTEYGVGWLPLGGYVKISGMIDESMDKEQMKKPAEPWEFRAKPTWQRLIIMIGGVVVNLILGMLIYMMVLFVWGKDTLPSENVTYGIHADEFTTKLGFQNGDRIISVEGKKPDNFLKIGKDVLLNESRNITVDRDGEKIDIVLPANVDEQMIDSGVKTLFTPRFPAVIGATQDDSPAQLAGLEKLDSVTDINGTSILFWDELTDIVSANVSKPISVTYIRNGEEFTKEITTTEEGTIGIANADADRFFKFDHHEYSFFASIPAGISYGVETLTDYVVSLKFLFSYAGVKQIGGFGAIGNMFSATWDWHSFWLMTALLSIILCVMNILPIPALDGGHVMFLTYEMLTGRKPNEKIMEWTQMAGMIILLAFLLYANGMDIFRGFFK